MKKAVVPDSGHFLDICCTAITADMTQMTSRATSSPQSTSTTGHAVNRQATSLGLKQTTGQSRQPSSDDHSSQHRHRHRQTHASTPVPVVSGMTPVNVDVVERVRHSSSTSAASASTTGRGAPLDSSSLTPTAPSRERRRRYSRQHSVVVAETHGSSTTNDVSGSKAVVSSERLNSTAPATTNHDEVVDVPRRSNAAEAEGRPTNGNVDQQPFSEHDATPSVVSSRYPSSATQQPPFRSHSLDATSSATNGQTSTSAVRQSRTESPSRAAGTRPKSPGDTGSSKYTGGESGDADKQLATAHVPRRLRRRRRLPAAGSPTNDVGNVDPKPPGNDDGDMSASRRLTMPSVVHYNAQYQSTPPAAPPRRQLPSRPPPERPVSAVYVLSDGVRRRLVPADGGEPTPPQSAVYDVQPSTELDELAEPPRRYYLEPAAASHPGGSMGNVVDGGQRAAVWRREDVSVLSEQRREEIRREKELNEQQTVFLRFDDIKVTFIMYLCSPTLNLVGC